MTTPASADAGTTPPRPDANGAFNTITLGLAIASPLAMMLPPRKMDLRFFILSGVFSFSTNQLAYNYTGQSLYSRFSSRVSSLFDTTPPPGIQRARERLREEKAARRLKEIEDQRRLLGQPPLDDKDREMMVEEANEPKGVVGAVKKAWMGGEKGDWKKERLEHERQALEEGRGYGDLIAEHIRDAFPGSKGGGESEGPK